MAAALLASATAACSSDSSRFGDNAFTNPFAASASSKVDRSATTGSLAKNAAPLRPVATQPLPPALPRTAGVANPLNPSEVATAPQAATARVASSTLQQAAPIGGSAAGWTSTGGTPVTVGAGETASTLSARYGVPAAAILAANGGAIRSGQQAIIPIYNGVGAATSAATTAAKTAAVTTAATGTAAASSAATSARSSLKAIEPTLLPDEDERPAPKPTASAPKPVASTPATQKLTPPKPVAATPVPPKPAAAETSRRIVAAAPKGPTPAQAAARPAKPATPVKPADDDDDEEETPRKVAQALPPAQPAPQAAPKPAASQAKPAQSQAAQPARPQPRVIPLTPQKKEEEAPARSASLMQADPTTTQSIPPQKPAVQAPAVAPAPAPAAAASAEERADFRWPARGRVISGFGSKGGNGDGIAIAVPEGTPVKAASDGVVAYAGEELKGYGKLVLVRHDNGYVSAYAHNGELNVKRGEKVSRGQTIAKSGATGNVTSPQLHFELRKGSTPVDPTKYLEN